ncbi:MAG TPA: F0F1 ATP synthase subunit A [Tepidisphaeraceae bacterium]|jgi:F0F1-type ATP synthase membrane subunit a|nr:F0F1 ATP synthase subunit A [Tepidisphaeraceae bacterium]
MIILAADPIEHVLPHPLFGSHLTWFTNQSLMALVSAVLMLLIFPRLFSRPDSSAPTGTKNFFEAILEFLRIEVFRPALKEHTDKFVPFLWTVFFFILFCNVLGCLPIPEIVGVATMGHLQHIGGTATGSISTTATLAVIAFFFIHFHGIDTLARALMDGTYGQPGHHQEHTSNGRSPHEAVIDLEPLRGEGLPADVPGNLDALRDPIAHYHDDEYRGRAHEQAAAQFFEEQHNKMTPGWAILLALPLYLWNFAPHPFRPKEGESQVRWLMDLPMFILLLIIELIGAVIKPFALCMRLFANMVAGHAVLAVLISLIVSVPAILTQLAIGIPIGVMDMGIWALELFVALLQAYIFTFLVTLFLASAIAPEH